MFRITKAKEISLALLSVALVAQGMEKKENIIDQVWNECEGSYIAQLPLESYSEVMKFLFHADVKTWLLHHRRKLIDKLYELCTQSDVIIKDRCLIIRDEEQMLSCNLITGEWLTAEYSKDQNSSLKGKTIFRPEKNSIFESCTNSFMQKKIWDTMTLSKLILFIKAAQCKRAKNGGFPSVLNLKQSPELYQAFKDLPQEMQETIACHIEVAEPEEENKKN